MHVPSDPILRPPPPSPARRRRASSAFRVLEEVVDSVWSERERATSRSRAEDTLAATELIVDPHHQPEEETQVEVDIVGAMQAIFARLPRRPSSVTRDNFQRPRPMEAKTEELDLPQIEEVAEGLSADGLEWLDQADLIEL